jgi:hypothetical protein
LGDHFPECKGQRDANLTIPSINSSSEVVPELNGKGRAEAPVFSTSVVKDAGKVKVTVPVGKLIPARKQSGSPSSRYLREYQDWPGIELIRARKVASVEFGPLFLDSALPKKSGISLMILSKLS